MTSTLFHRCCALLLLGVVVVPGAMAQSQPLSADVCRDDAIKLCRATRPGGGRVMACLESSKERLSGPCRSALPQLNACTQEVRKVCESADGATALRDCARAHAADLSPACRAALP